MREQIAYFSFLRYILNDHSTLSAEIFNVNWKDFLFWSEKQAILGIVYDGISTAGKEINIPFDVLMKWIGYANQIENCNRKLNKKCIEVTSEYRNVGFSCMFLKGQGNATMYSKPLLRQPGDIDLLILNADRKKIIEYTKTKHEIGEIRYHHLEYDDNGISVEVHFIPCQMNNPIYHRRLMKWLREHSEIKESAELPDVLGKLPVPSKDFNLVFQLAHMMHHFFDEGIGLRQMMDYYYLLRSSTKLEIRKEKLEMTLKYLGLWKFAGAVMYVMREVFGMEEQFMIALVDERRGRTLLNEILKGGNFGKYSGLTQHSTGGKYFLKHWRNLHFVREYPSEALCEPIFRTWHFFWRLRHC